MLLFLRALNLLGAAVRVLFPTLLPLARALDLLLSLLFPTLLAFGAVLLLFLAALLRTLLLLRLLLLPLRFAFLPPLVAARPACGLVLLTPLVTAASSALSTCEVACAKQQGGYRKRQSNLFDLLHFVSFLSVLTSGERSTQPHLATAVPSSKRKEIRSVCVMVRNDMIQVTNDMG